MRIKKFIKVALAVMIIASAVIVQTGCTSEKQVNDLYSYHNIKKFDFLPRGNGSDVLVGGDGCFLAMKGAYYNGEKLYVALRGEYHPGGSNENVGIDSIIINAVDKAIFTVNEKAVDSVDKEIVLTEIGDHYEGVIALDVVCEESLASFKMEVTSVDLYSGGELISTANGPYIQEGAVKRIYTENEEKVLSGDDEIYIKYAVINDGVLVIDYIVPESFSESFDEEIRLTAYGEDGSLLELQDESRQGTERSTLFTAPDAPSVYVIIESVGESSNVELQKYKIVPAVF